MRVRVTRHDRDERGAISIAVALLSVFLLVMSGFVVDFGQSFMSKRNLQKAADAGALAGAQALTKYRGTCNSVASNSLARAAAFTAADSFRKNPATGEQVNRESHLPEAVVTNFDVRCDPALKTLVVEYGLEGVTSSTFGSLAGGDDTISTERDAEATVDVGPSSRATPMRPLAICSSLIDAPYAIRSGDFIKVTFPGTGHVPPDVCPVSASGNWWLIDCPGERLGSASGLRDQILNGCPPEDRVTVIPGQADASTPGALTLVIDEACPDATIGDESCMSGHTGNITQGGTPGVWDTFMRTGETGLFPVFCAPPRCSTVTAGGSGTNAVFPISSLMSAVVCGYHFDHRAGNRGLSSHANCTGNPYNPTTDSTTANYIIFKLVTLRASGSNAESECALGDEKCDGGLRRTRLTN